MAGRFHPQIAGGDPMMTNMIAIKGANISTMSSKEMAKLTEKRHDSVKRTVNTLAEKGIIAFPQIVETSFTGANGRKQTVTEYRVEERDSYIIVAQLSPEFTARLVDRWQELEAQQPKLGPANLTRMDILRLAMDAEERCVKAEVERDHAIATKAQIGSRREATSMATASTHKLEAERLKARLGINTRYATVKSVEKLTGKKYLWLPLRRWCEVTNVVALDVPDPIYGYVKSWPRDAWGEIYGINLIELFSDQGGRA